MSSWKGELLQFLSPHVSDHKRARFEEVLDFRTRHLQIWLENIGNLHDAGAVFRSAECLGVQEVHLFDPPARQSLGRGVAVGATKWLELVKHQTRANPSQAMAAVAPGSKREWLKGFRERGFRIIAVSPAQTAQQPAELKLEQPLLLCFGGDPDGLSEETLAACDEQMHLGTGVQTLNLSARVAAHLYPLVKRLHRSEIPWQLPPQGRDDLRLRWYYKVPKSRELLLARFVELHPDLCLAELQNWLNTDEAKSQNMEADT